ncbi:MAG TPA: cyclic nucleotide-binding domain-containing protein [Acidimicrobiales bacterium]|nr:cyclic nucleotide-binding domain-containing protein [Acidimicrobiales bacterium]
MSTARNRKVRKRRWWETGCASLDTLCAQTLQELCRRGDQYTAWPGQTLLAGGTRVHWVFVVLDGELVVRRGETDLQVLHAGCIFGGLESLGPIEAPGDLVARDVSRVLALPVNAYTGLVQTRPDFAFWVLRAVARDRERAA